MKEAVSRNLSRTSKGQREVVYRTSLSLSSPLHYGNERHSLSLSFAGDGDVGHSLKTS